MSHYNTMTQKCSCNKQNIDEIRKMIERTNGEKHRQVYVAIATTLKETKEKKEL